MKTEYYKKVYIKTEDDLPKEGTYLVQLKNSDRDPYYWEFEEGSPANYKYWLKRIDWYLQPVKEELYPKSFIEWLSYKSPGNFQERIELHKYWDGTINEWRSVFRVFDGLRWVDITIDELLDYWTKNIKEK